LAYFDNAATTFPKPQSVYDYMDKFYRSDGVNTGRGQYSLAQAAAELVSDTRQKLQQLLHCPAKQIVFTPTDTIALNIILQGLCTMGVKSVYVSPFEHNAVTRTLHHYELSGLIEVHQLAVSKNYEYDLQRIQYQFDAEHPDLVVVSHASNVIGLVAPIEDIFSLAKKYGAFTVADMAQTAGLVDCNVGLSSFDFATFAGHKTLYGPTGISGFAMNPDIKLPPLLFGGTGYESANQDMPDTLPERYEMGTLNIAGVAGLNAALKWILDMKPNTLFEHECQKRARLLEILEEYEMIKVVGNANGQKYVGIVSCIIEGLSSDSAGTVLSQRNIAVRTGLHCAPAAHQFMGTYPAGTIRFSIGAFTSEQDFVDLKEALDYITENV